MSRDWSYRVRDKLKQTYSDKAFSIDQNGIPYVQDEDGYWEEAGDRYVFEFSTGLEDKNGKMIREGDLLVAKYKGEIIRVAEVYWDESVPGFECNIVMGSLDNVFSWLEEYEVVGNVHEIVELPGGEE